jgi:hypothetical protein
VISGLEPNFSKLTYVNKINILLKALMMERNKNYESQVKIDILKREYEGKCRLIEEQNRDNDKLIEKVANADIANDNYLSENQLMRAKLIELKHEHE